jgi:hypothetical protein
MPALYVDTSALVKRYVGEVGTLWVRRALARPVRQPLYTSVLAHTEVLSALQRKVRDGDARGGRRPAPGPACAAPLCATVPSGGNHACARAPGQCARAGASLAGV